MSERRSHHAAKALPPGEPRAAGGTKRRCKARRRDGQPCRQWAAPGQLVCYLHGGASPQAKRRGAQRTAAERLGLLVGERLVVAPDVALLGQVHEAAGNVEALRQMMQQAEARQAEGAVAAAERELLWVRYTEERERLARFSKAAIDAGLAERQVRMAEATTRVIVGVVQGMLEASEMGLSPAQRILGRQLAHRLLLEQSHLQVLPPS